MSLIVWEAQDTAGRGTHSMMKMCAVRLGRTNSSSSGRAPGSPLVICQPSFSRAAARFSKASPLGMTFMAKVPPGQPSRLHLCQWILTSELSLSELPHPIQYQ